MKNILKKEWLKKNVLFYLGVLTVFIIAACVYCAPVLQGKVINSGDGISGASAVQESVHFYDSTGESTCWTNSMFSGMPNYQIGGHKYLTARIIEPITSIFYRGYGNGIFILLYYFIAFFVLLRTFGINKWMSIAGAFATGFSTYFLIIIAASHGGKTTAITWMTLVLIGTLLLYRKKYIWGAFTIMFFLMLAFPPHPQMAYYMCMLIGVLICAEFYIHIKEKRMKDWLIATGIFIASFAVGMGTQMTNNLVNLEYVQETMRGGHSELEDGDVTKNDTKSGLDIDYATMWSYGIDESLTFLIPNFMGGANGYKLDDNSLLYKELIKKGVPDNSAKEFCSSSPAYWGAQPFTHGPVYMGAIVCFLFVLALFIVRGPYKWALIVVSVLSLFLSWGHNMLWFTELFFYNVPMYNKFRAVSSILIIAEIAVPLLGFMSLKVIADGTLEKKKILSSIKYSAAITGGLCLILALAGGSLFSFVSKNDVQFQSQLPEWLYSAILDQRASMLKTDAWRSFAFIVFGAGVVWAYASNKVSVAKAGMMLTILVVTDMWGVNKRYFNEDSYTARINREQVFVKQPYEQQILKDKDPHFRVLNLTTNTFNDARTSYYLKSVGGYSAAKLRRYQDLIDRHLSKMNMEVVNMLNAKYIITAQDGQAVPQLNTNANGNAWFIDSLVYVNTPTEEINELNAINTKRTAVIDVTKFPNSGLTVSNDDNATIKLTSYTPREIHYESNSQTSGTAVFSEVYYPYGWEAYIDGELVEHSRVNYVLRALNIPEGKHEIRFEFNPQSVKYGNMLSAVCLTLMLITLIAAIAWEFRTLPSIITYRKVQ